MSGENNNNSSAPMANGPLQLASTVVYYDVEAQMRNHNRSNAGNFRNGNVQYEQYRQQAANAQYAPIPTVPTQEVRHGMNGQTNGHFQPTNGMNAYAYTQQQQNMSHAPMPTVLTQADYHGMSGQTNGHFQPMNGMNAHSYIQQQPNMNAQMPQIATQSEMVGQAQGYSQPMNQFHGNYNPHAPGSTQYVSTQAVHQGMNGQNNGYYHSMNQMNGNSYDQQQTFPNFNQQTSVHQPNQQMPGYNALPVPAGNYFPPAFGQSAQHYQSGPKALQSGVPNCQNFAEPAHHQPPNPQPSGVSARNQFNQPPPGYPAHSQSGQREMSYPQHVSHPAQHQTPIPQPSGVSARNQFDQPPPGYPAHAQRAQEEMSHLHAHLAHHQAPIPQPSGASSATEPIQRPPGLPRPEPTDYPTPPATADSRNSDQVRIQYVPILVPYPANFIVQWPGVGNGQMAEEPRAEPSPSVQIQQGQKETQCVGSIASGSSENEKIPKKSGTTPAFENQHAGEDIQSDVRASSAIAGKNEVPQSNTSTAGNKGACQNQLIVILKQKVHYGITKKIQHKEDENKPLVQIRQSTVTTENRPTPHTSLPGSEKASKNLSNYNFTSESTGTKPKNGGQNAERKNEAAVKVPSTTVENRSAPHASISSAGSKNASGNSSNYNIKAERSGTKTPIEKQQAETKKNSMFQGPSTSVGKSEAVQSDSAKGAAQKTAANRPMKNIEKKKSALQATPAAVQCTTSTQAPQTSSEAQKPVPSQTVKVVKGNDDSRVESSKVVAGHSRSGDVVSTTAKKSVETQKEFIREEVSTKSKESGGAQSSSESSNSSSKRNECEPGVPQKQRNECSEDVGEQIPIHTLRLTKELKEVSLERTVRVPKKSKAQKKREKEDQMKKEIDEIDRINKEFEKEDKKKKNAAMKIERTDEKRPTGNNEPSSTGKLAQANVKEASVIVGTIMREHPFIREEEKEVAEVLVAYLYVMANTRCKVLNLWKRDEPVPILESDPTGLALELLEHCRSRPMKWKGTDFEREVIINYLSDQVEVYRQSEDEALKKIGMYYQVVPKLNDYNLAQDFAYLTRKEFNDVEREENDVRYIRMVEHFAEKRKEAMFHEATLSKIIDGLKGETKLEERHWTHFNEYVERAYMYKIFGGSDESGMSAHEKELRRLHLSCKFDKKWDNSDTQHVLETIQRQVKDMKPSKKRDRYLNFCNYLLSVHSYILDVDTYLLAYELNDGKKESVHNFIFNVWFAG
uniref:C3H1-type domain-containing protein n=1 Tax=Caenorhabditis tropicalis TaxID=1561998 RepID=A0A1I7USF8_9PELO